MRVLLWLLGIAYWLFDIGWRVMSILMVYDEYLLACVGYHVLCSM